MVKNVKELVLGLGLIVVAGLYFGSESKEDKMIKAFNNLKSGQIGYHRVIADAGNYDMYEIVTPRGVEKVAGQRNLMNSLETYYKNGVLGKEVK